MPAHIISRAFVQWCGELTSSFQDAQSAYNVGHIQPRTFHSVTELAALQLHSRVETLLEELFLSCTLGTSGIEVDRLLLPVGREQAMSLLMRDSGRNEYLTWLPIDSTHDRAARFFRYGRPFSRIRCRPSLSVPLSELTVVRNAVAHPGQLAGRKFSELEKARGYPAGRPADFLLAVRDGATEFEHLLAASKVISRVLAEPSEMDLDTIAGPERRFTSDEKLVPPGNYTCVLCAATVVLAGGGQLARCVCSNVGAGACQSCGQASPCTTCSRPRKVISEFTRVPLPA